MKVDWFAALRVPGVPGTSPATGDSANPHEHGVSPVSPASPVRNINPVGCAPLADPSAPCPTCGCGSYWQAVDAWHCESCEPPPANATRWRNVSGGRAAPIPAPAVPWPAELTDALKRVSTAFEWTDADRREFVTWARRSPRALADAGEFLAAEVAKLPPPGLDERRRVVLAMLADEPALRVAWTCADDGESDPVLLTLAIRGKGSCELAIPRARFDALALPLLISELEQQRGDE